VSPSPAPGLVDSWFTWAFVLTVVATFALVVLTVEILKARETLSQDRLDALYDEHIQQQVNDYHCAGHGHYMQVDGYDKRGTTWTCVNCAYESWVPFAAKVYNQDGVA